MESNKLLTKIRKKRIAVVIVMVAVIFLITYFVFPLYFMLSKQNIKMKDKLFSYLSDKDTEKFTDMFSPAAKADPDFDENVSEIFNLVNGEFTDESWRYIHRTTYSSESYNFDYGRLSKLGWEYTFINIPTDTGKTYTFYVRYTVINDSAPKNKGVNCFAAVSTDDSDDYVMIASDEISRITFDPNA